MKKALLAVSSGTLLGLSLLAGGQAFAGCSDWSFNDPNCPAYIQTEMSGKAAYGMTSGELKLTPAAGACSDWSYNDSNCSAYVREGAGSRDTGFEPHRTIFNTVDGG